MVNFKLFYKSLLFGFFIFGFKSSLMAQEAPSAGAWSVSKEAATTFENQDPVALAQKINNYQQRILSYAEAQGKVSELDELRNSYYKKQASLAPHYPTVPLGATYDQIHAWLRQYPAEAEHYQNILDSILQGLNQ
ncbi:MAG: hypothetical protein NWS31_08695 [Crocinitomicaceae bacterium]|nr:hypothetical protein [Crocinitomicaceae bacterium]MDP4739492.1 hypothetical protein [Crocinitomicaceae bacterium]MDP4799309.1 hypothetical protein [Crocinitomicaceae bacterium]MDP4806763.1 hypothetical protein [Crocinitomicaceae bacterium]MDP4867548.1 hypothetical protein [Crocinitomicaceae bacterium]